MKNLILISTICMLLINSVSANTSSEKLNVSYNKNMELLGLLYTIVYENPNSPSFDNTDENWEFGQKIIKEYGHFHQSEILLEMVPAVEHLWISDFTYLLTRVDDFPNAKLTDKINTNYLMRFSKTRNQKEAIQNVTIFLEGMNKIIFKLPRWIIEVA